MSLMLKHCRGSTLDTSSLFLWVRTPVDGSGYPVHAMPTRHGRNGP